MIKSSTGIKANIESALDGGVIKLYAGTIPAGEAMIECEIREGDGKFWVGHEDQNGEWWDADIEGFDSIEDAERFLIKIQSEQGAV